MNKICPFCGWTPNYDEEYDRCWCNNPECIIYYLGCESDKWNERHTDPSDQDEV